jgi:TolB-like protein/DNA-binding winged helix-turn-helix (wHTH) protein/tetratricopeptide (TPR) repeat protein
MTSDPPVTRRDPEAVRYRFGDIEVDVAAHVITRAGEPQPLEPKAFAVLLELLRHAGELVGREQLLDAVWGHRHVTPGVLTRAIAQLRTALGDDPHHPRWIRTQHALGYRFVGTLLGEARDASAAPETDAGSGKQAVAATEAAPASAGPQGPPVTAVAAPAAIGAGTAVPARIHRPGGRRRADRRPATRWLLLAGLVAIAAVAWLRQDPPMLPDEPSIAVLPFTTIGDDPQDRWFAEGLALEMFGALAQVDGLKVAAWRDAASLGQREDTSALGRALGVATVLDATVRRDGDRVRIQARLTDAASGYTLWSHAFDRDVGAVFQTQGEIATEVARALVGALPDDGEGLRRRLTPTRDVAAFDAYLQGLQALVQPARADDDAMRHFRAALARDPGFARAQAGICRLELWRFEAQRVADAFASARLACLRAANMDPTIGVVQLALGDLYRAQGPAARALEHYRLAEADRSVRADALAGQASVQAAEGRPALSVAAFRQALELAPEDAAIHAALGYQQYLAGQLADAAGSLRRATELDPADAYLWSTLGGVLLAADRRDEAVSAFERSLAIEPVGAVLTNLGTLRYQAGDYPGAAGYYRRAIELDPDGNPSAWGSLGDALLAEPRTAADAPAVFREAATRAQAYVDIAGDDAKALAMLGWFRANLGERDAALALAARAEALGAQPGEVALYNAQTYAILGEPDRARGRIDAARAAGIAETRLTTNAVLRRAGMTPADAAAPTRSRAAGAPSAGERE